MMIINDEGEDWNEKAGFRLDLSSAIEHDRSA